MQKSGICSLSPFPSLPGLLAGGSLTLQILHVWGVGKGQGPGWQGLQQDLGWCLWVQPSLGLDLGFVSS